MRVVLVLVAGMALVIPTPASAKSWIWLSAPPDRPSAGERWETMLTFPRHPYAGPLPQRPEVVFTNLATWQQRRFTAARTQAVGVYRVQVSLPTAGTWTVYVYDRAIGAVTPDPRSRHVVVGPADSVSGAPLGLLAAGAAAVGAARSASPLDDVRVSANASPVRQVEKQSRLHLSSAGSAAGA